MSVRALFSVPPQFPARLDPKYKFTFATLSTLPGLDMVGNTLKAALGTLANNRLGQYRDLSANAATVSYTTPMPTVKYTIIKVFVPAAGAGSAITFCRTTTNGLRVEFFNTGGGVYYRVTNNGVANGPQLVASTTFDGVPWAAITTYDGVTIKSWMQKLGDPTTRQSGSAASGYLAGTGTFDIGAGVANTSFHMIAMSLTALSDVDALTLLENPWRIFVILNRNSTFAPPAAAGAGFFSRYYYDMLGQSNG